MAARAKEVARGVALVQERSSRQQEVAGEVEEGGVRSQRAWWRALMTETPMVQMTALWMERWMAL